MLVKKISEFVFLSLIFLGIYLIYDAIQPLVIHHQGKGWDGAWYYKLSEMIMEGQKLILDGPFVTRPGAPFMAQFVSKFFQLDLLLAHKYYNIGVTYLSFLLLWCWLSLFLEKSIFIIFGCVLWALPWFAPLRFSIFAPPDTHPSLFIFLLLGFIIVELYRRKILSFPLSYFLMTCILVIGAWFREASLSLGILFAAEYLRQKDFFNFSFTLKNVFERPSIIFEHYKTSKIITKDLFICLSPIFWGLISYFLLGLVVIKTNSHTFIQTTMYYFMSQSPMIWLLALFNTYSAILTCLFLGRKYLFKNSDHFKAYIIFVIAIFFMGYIGGQDFEHFMYWTSPLVLLAFLKLLQEKEFRDNLSWPFITLASFVWLLSHRVFLVNLSDHLEGTKNSIPFLTPILSDSPFLNQYASWSSKTVACIAFSQHLIMSAILIYLYRKREMSRNMNKKNAF